MFIKGYSCLLPDLSVICSSLTAKGSHGFQRVGSPAPQCHSSHQGLWWGRLTSLGRNLEALIRLLAAHLEPWEGTMWNHVPVALWTSVLAARTPCFIHRAQWIFHVSKWQTVSTRLVSRDDTFIFFSFVKGKERKRGPMLESHLLYGFTLRASETGKQHS